MNSSTASPAFTALVIGFYGAPNVGDEILLEILLRRVRELGGESIVASIDPELTQRMHSVNAVAFTDLGGIARILLQCDVLIMGGGGIFQDHHPFNLDAVYAPYVSDIAGYARPMLMARQLGVPVYVWGHGVGPLRTDGARTLVRELFEYAAGVSVRDTESQELLQQLGVRRDVVVGADPGWLYRRLYPLESVRSGTAPPTLSIVVREWEQGQWKATLAEGLKRAIPKDWRIQWLAFQADTARSGALSDLPVINELREMLGYRPQDVVLTPSTPSEAWCALSEADAVFSMRLHASVMSLLAGLPTAGLEYDQKLSHVHQMALMPTSLRLSVDDTLDRFIQALECVIQGKWAPDAGVISELEASAGVHLDLLQGCRALKPSELQFDGLALDWLGLWLQQALEELDRVRERSRKAHELLSFRDIQLADKEAALSAVYLELDDAGKRLATEIELREALVNDLEAAKESASFSSREIDTLRVKLDQVDAALMLSQRDAESSREYIQDKEVYIALLRQQVDQLQEELRNSRRETAEARDRWRRLRELVMLVRRDVIRLAAAPVKLTAVWRRYGMRTALEQIPRRLRTLGRTLPDLSGNSGEVQSMQPPRPVRRERLLVLAARADLQGWSSRAIELAKGAERAGFLARIRLSTDEGSASLPGYLLVDDAGWLQEVRAEGTRVLLADSSPRAIELAGSARRRGATVIIDLDSLDAGIASSPRWQAVMSIADIVMGAGVPATLPAGLESERLEEAGDNELFDSYREYERPGVYEESGRHVLVHVFEGAREGRWLLDAAERHVDVIFQVVVLGDAAWLPQHPRIRALNWPRDQVAMVPYLAHAHAVVILGGGAANEYSRRRLAISTLLLERPLFVERDLGLPFKSRNLVSLEEVETVAIDRASSLEDYGFVSRMTWLGRVEQLMRPVYPESVSVVVLIHNNGRIIERCIDTLLLHAGRWLEDVVVVDNQSTDDGAELVERRFGMHPKVRLVRNNENGCSSGRNLGVRHSKGRYIAFFDSDQWLTSASCFSEAVGILEREEGVGTIGWNAGWFDATRNDLGGPISDYLPARGMNAEARIKGYRDDVGFLGTSCMFISRELFESLDGFDTFYDPTCFEDTDICFQVKRAGYSVAFRDLAGVRHQPHQTTGASGGSERYKKLFTRNANYFREKWRDHPEFFVDLKSWH